MASKTFEDVTVCVPVSRWETKTIPSTVGDFDIQGVKIGDKFVRFVFPKGHRLPDGMVEGHLYPRSYETKNGKFQELAIWVDNSVEVKE